jgi:preprotein translocase subunit SecA
MIDEVDSILLDESNQPLIMGFPIEDELLKSRLEISDKVVSSLRGCPTYYASGEPIPVDLQERYPGDFTTDVMAARKSLEFTDAGQEKVVQMLGAGPNAQPGSSIILLALLPHPPHCQASLLG